MSYLVKIVEGKDKVSEGVLFNGRDLAVYHWAPPQGGYSNFGDEIAPMVVRRLLERSGKGHVAVVPPERGRPKLLAIGSVLHKADHGDVIWGSGVNGKVWPRNIERDIRLDVRLVRGPLTRAALIRASFHCPEVYGDPGLLFPMLFESEINEYGKQSTDARILYVPNLNDDRFVDQSEYKALKYLQYVSPSRSPYEVAALIAKADLVIASSLHAIVFADYYGVPVIPVSSMFEPLYKYVDYFESTGRGPVRFASSVEEALDGRELGPAQFDCDAIMAAFPFDVLE